MILFNKKWINPNHISCAYVSESDTNIGYIVCVQVGPTLLTEFFSKKHSAENRLETILKTIDYARTYTSTSKS